MRYILILCLFLSTSCGDTQVTESTPVQRANQAAIALTNGFSYLDFVGARVFVASEEYIQNLCDESPYALSAHYNNIPDFRCMIAIKRIHTNPFIDRSVSLYITSGTDRHICEQTLYGFLENYYLGGPIILFGRTYEPAEIVPNWCDFD